MSEKITFKAGKRTRNELYLPALRFVTADDWINKLGETAFCSWLKMHTWVDRSDADRDYDKVPYTLEDTWKKLGMSKSKFYTKVVHPLWNYGLIDIVEYEESNRKSQKPKNIIVYACPFNRHELEVKPLEKLRDYDKDYQSSSQVFGKKGGRPATSHPLEDGFKNKTVGSDRFKIKTVTVSKLKRYRVLKIKRSTVLKLKPNNITNKHTNKSNNPNNGSNNGINGSNNKQQQIEKEIEKQIVVVVQNQQLFQHLFKQSISPGKIMELMEVAKKHGKNLADCMRNAKLYLEFSGKPAENPIGLVRYEIQTGWDLSSVKPKDGGLEIAPPADFSKFDWVNQ